MKGYWKSQKNLSRLERKLSKQKTRVELTSGRIAEEVYNRLIELEDIEAIRKLKAAYCDACDDDHDGDAVAALFVKNGTWQQIGGTKNADDRKRIGKEEIADFMFGLREAGFIKRSSHIVTNPVISVQGDQASGLWKFLMLYTHQNGTYFRIIGRYEDNYVKRNKEWFFKSLTAHVEENGPYQNGDLRD